MAKRRVGSVNVKGTARDMEEKIEQAFSSIGADDWRKCAEHVIKLEEEHKQQDRLFDELDPFVINVRSDDDSDDIDDDYEDIEHRGADFVSVGLVKEEYTEVEYLDSDESFAD